MAQATRILNREIPGLGVFGRGPFQRIAMVRRLRSAGAACFYVATVFGTLFMRARFTITIITVITTPYSHQTRSIDVDKGKR